MSEFFKVYIYIHTSYAYQQSTGDLKAGFLSRIVEMQSQFRPICQLRGGGEMSAVQLSGYHLGCYCEQYRRLSLPVFVSR